MRRPAPLRRALPWVAAALLTSPGAGAAPPSQESAAPWLPLPAGTVDAVAFGSCSNQYLPQPVWDALASSGADLFLHLGDAIYGDAAPPGNRRLAASIDRIAKMRIDYQFLATHPGFVKAKRAMPMLFTWDDHDYGENDGGADFELRSESRELHFEFLQVPADSPRRAREGVYDAHVFGPEGRRVQVVMLDTRSFRGPLRRANVPREEARERRIVGRYAPGSDPSVSMLGEAQWTWLAEQLEQPAEVRLVVSSIQVVAGEKGAESWANLPHERQRLYDLIRSSDASGVLFLSGDVHFSEVSRTDDGPYPLTDFTSSPLAQYPTGSTGWEDCVNSFRVGGTYEKDSFGLVEIDWEAQPGPRIELRVVGVDGSRHLAHSVLLAELQAR